MWKYKELTRTEFESRKDFTEGILKELGASPTDLGTIHPVTTYDDQISETIFSDRTVFEYGNCYYRIDEVLFNTKPFIVIECADTIMDVRNNAMEDSDPFPYDLSDDEIREEVRLTLRCS